MVDSKGSSLTGNANHAPNMVKVYWSACEDTMRQLICRHQHLVPQHWGYWHWRLSGLSQEFCTSTFAFAF